MIRRNALSLLALSYMAAHVAWWGLVNGFKIVGGT